jgi:hypothetical protein
MANIRVTLLMGSPPRRQCASTPLFRVFDGRWHKTLDSANDFRKFRISSRRGRKKGQRRSEKAVLFQTVTGI